MLELRPIGAALPLPLPLARHAATDEVSDAVGRCAQDGWRALRDVRTPRGRIDHLLIGPAGIIALATRRSQLRSIQARAAWIEKVSNVRADTLVVLAGADREARYTRQRDAWILPATMLQKHLFQRGRRLTPSGVEVVHERIAAAL